MEGLMMLAEGIKCCKPEFKGTSQAAKIVGP